MGNEKLNITIGFNCLCKTLIIQFYPVTGMCSTTLWGKEMYYKFALFGITFIKILHNFMFVLFLKKLMATRVELGLMYQLRSIGVTYMYILNFSSFFYNTVI